MQVSRADQLQATPAQLSYPEKGWRTGIALAAVKVVPVVVEILVVALVVTHW